MFFNSAAAAGQNVNACYAPNQWATIGGSSTGNLPAQSGSAGYLLSNGSTMSWGNIATGGTGALDCSTIPGVCDEVTAIAPLKTAPNVWTGANDFSGATLLRLVTGAGAPASGCALPTDVGSVYMRSDAQTTGASLYVCSETGKGIYSWELGQSASASALPVYSAAGAQLSAHLVTGLSSFISAAAAISFSGAAAFSSVISYACTANDLSSATAVVISQTSGSTVVFSTQSGGANDNFSYICVGN
jgi:hypothetical protein